MTQKILIIDDDAKLINLLSEYLHENGFEISSLMEGTHALKTIRDIQPDLIILDIMLPGKDGLDVLKEIRTDISVPVIMLTARGDDTDRIVGLELGADDYLPKPFNPRELLARVRAILRRQERTSPPGRDDHIRSGDMVLNLAARMLTIQDSPVELSTTV